MLPGIFENIVSERGGCQRYRLARDDSPGTGECPSVIRSQIGIRIDDVDTIGARAEHGGGHLTGRSHRSIAHLGRAHPEMIAPLRLKYHDGARTPLRRRSAIEHCERDAGALGPLVSVGFGSPTTRGQGRFDQVETLIEAVAAETDIPAILTDRIDTPA